MTALVAVLFNRVQLTWAATAFGASLMAAAIGLRWHRIDLGLGVDYAQAAERRLGPAHLIRRIVHRRRVRRYGWINEGGLIVGEDHRSLPVTIPVGFTSGRHTLVPGATGSGKTVSQTWVACRLIDVGYAGIVIDPKGDELLRADHQASAHGEGRRFLEWTPEGPCTYNPYGEGGASEIADKALSGETFTEPHYQRQAQRYLGHAVRTLQQTGKPVTPHILAEAMRPEALDVLARELPEVAGEKVHGYLDSLDDRSKRDLKGVRDRLSILTESDIGPHLEPTEGTPAIDLHEAVRERAVVYFRLDADRHPLLAQMLAGAIISDLVALEATMQRGPIPTIVMIDEFAAIAAAHGVRLFGRARSAGISLILGTQELADLTTAADGRRDQVLGNLDAMIAHRQNVPESAELIAAMAGTKAAWVTTEQTQTAGLGHGASGRGSRRRGYEYILHPSQIKQLQTGEAAVITPGRRPAARIAHMHHPQKSHPAPPRRFPSWIRALPFLSAPIRAFLRRG